MMRLDPTLPSADDDIHMCGEDRLEKSRERNREHAKQTRLRKKNHLDAMKSRLLHLQEEALKLHQLLDENNTANILLRLSVPEKITDEVPPSTVEFEAFKGDLVDQLKHSVRIEAADKRKFSFPPLDDSSSSKRQRNNCVSDSTDSTTGSEADACQDEKLRKERNRMHAKLTRDRKKLFTTKVSQMITKLEKQNKTMFQKLLAAQNRMKYPYSMMEEGQGSPYHHRDDSPRDVWSECSHEQTVDSI